MKCIPVYQKGDQFIYVPISNLQKKGGARAFLPFNGLDGDYSIGYKANPKKVNNYIEALSFIQNSYNKDEKKIFMVGENKDKPEMQKAFKWRHNDESLLEPYNWIKVNFNDLINLKIEDLLNQIDGLEKGGITDLTINSDIEPIICNTEEEWIKQGEHLKDVIRAGKIPKGQVKPVKTSTSNTVYFRDAAVRAYVLLQAKGLCENCGELAPFLDTYGNPFLEVHHVKPLHLEGTDTISNTVALCPNCHRMFHYSKDKDKLVVEVLEKIGRLIRE
jgi:5-methylcytosine-specific restriction enzyme A